MDIIGRLKLLEKAEDLESDAKQLTQRYLREAGWTYTSNNAGSLWLWVRELDGKQCMLSEGEALWFQKTLDSRDPANPENAPAKPAGEDS